MSNSSKIKPGALIAIVVAIVVGVWVAKKNNIDEHEVPLGQLPTHITPLHYHLDLELLPDQEGFNGKVTIKVKADQSVSVVWLHGKNLEMEQVTLEQEGHTQSVQYRQVNNEGVAKLELLGSFEGEFNLVFDYYAPYSKSLDAIYKVEESGRPYLFSQMEAISARMAFPSFDEPRFKTPFDMTITAYSKDTVVVNAPVAQSEDLGNGKTRHTFMTTEVLPTYLTAFAVGELDVVEWEPLPPNEIRMRPIPFRGIAAKGKGGQMAYAMEHTRAITESLERYFGVEYPYKKLDIIAAPDFAFGAMENAGAIVYREQLLLLDENSSANQKRRYGAVHAHELAHQWFGNLVTPTWWDDIWLNEAFATWMMYKAAHEWAPELEFDRSVLKRSQSAMAVDGRSAARQIRQPVNSNDDINNAFDSITYSKGGGVLQMFESYLGKERFKQGVQLHMERYRHSTADVHGFMKSLADGGNAPELVESFKSFLFQPGIPEVDVALNCNKGEGTLTLSQQRYVPLGIKKGKPQQWQIPFCYRSDIGQDCTMLKTEKAVMELDHCPKYLIPNANGDGYYRFSMEPDLWNNLFENFYQLNINEQLTALDNLKASFRAGKGDIESILAAMRRASQEKAWDVASAPLAELRFMKSVLLKEEGTEGYKNVAADIYGPLYKRLGLDPTTPLDKQSSVSTALLRSQVVSAMAKDAEDEALILELTSRAKAYLSGDKQAIQPDMLQIAFETAVKADSTFAAKLKNSALESTDGTFRQRALIAIAQTPDGELGAKWMAELLISKQVRSNEAQILGAVFMANKATRDATWNWLQGNIDDYLPRFSEFSVSRLASAGRVFCSKAKRKEVETFFNSQIAKISGGPRALAESLEAIDQCIALRKEYGAAASDQF